MAGQHTIEFNEGNFETEVVNSEQPVLVDFWAEWCGPCKLLGPTIDELAGEYAGKVKIGKLDIDRAPNIAIRFGVQNIPTVILFERGQPAQRILGARPKSEFKKLLDSKLGVGGPT